MAWINVGMAAYSFASSRIDASAQEAQGKNQRRALEYQAQQELLVAMEQADALRDEGAEFVESQRSGYAAAGVVVDAGTAGYVVQETQREIEQDAAQIILAGGRQANALRTQGAFAQAGAQLEASRTRSQGNMTALQYGYQAYGGWRDRQRPGAPVPTRPGGPAPVSASRPSGSPSRFGTGESISGRASRLRGSSRFSTPRGS